MNEFDLGSKLANWRATVGARPLLDLLSPAHTTPGDGTVFPRPHLLAKQ